MPRADKGRHRSRFFITWKEWSRGTRGGKLAVVRIIFLCHWSSCIECALVRGAADTHKTQPSLNTHATAVYKNIRYFECGCNSERVKKVHKKARVSNYSLTRAVWPCVCLSPPVDASANLPACCLPHFPRMIACILVAASRSLRALVMDRNSRRPARPR